MRFLLLKGTHRGQTHFLTKYLYGYLSTIESLFPYGLKYLLLDKLLVIVTYFKSYRTKGYLAICGLKLNYG